MLRSHAMSDQPDMRRSAQNAKQALVADKSERLNRSPFLRACQRQKTDYTPIWIMRQAGRFMPEYRQIRDKVGFLELCHNSQLAAEVTVMACEKLKVDAAIIFADILLPLEAMGARLEYAKGDGPIIHNPIRQEKDIECLSLIEPKESLAYVLEAIKLSRRALAPLTPLIGFAGAPFTLASYLIEGGSSRNFEKTKALMYRKPLLWHKLMDLLSAVTANYLNCQVEAGADCLQLFDSWVGCLSPQDYKEFVLPHMEKLFAKLDLTVPAIHFGTGTATLLELMAQAGGQVIGLDWRVELDSAWKRLGAEKAVQGNLDPCLLFAEKPEIKKRVAQILEQAQGRDGHIFNLGHGVLPETPVENVEYLVAQVHELGRK